MNILGLHQEKTNQNKTKNSPETSGFPASTRRKSVDIYVAPWVELVVVLLLALVEMKVLNFGEWRKDMET